MSFFFGCLLVFLVILNVINYRQRSKMTAEERKEEDERAENLMRDYAP